MACSCGNTCSDCRKLGGRVGKKYNQGGLLRGPSHERGGMPAIIGGKEPVELEGGEYVIRKSSVDKYGEGTIAKINQGLVDPNKLRQLKKGGPIRRKKMARGGRTKRKMQMGGRTSCPPGTHMMPDGTCMEGEYHGASTNTNRRTEMASRRGRRRGATYTGRQGGVRRASTRGGRRRSMSAGASRASRTGYKKGGRVSGRRRFQQGGHAHSQTPYLHNHQGAMEHDHGGDGQVNWHDYTGGMDAGNNPNSPYENMNFGPNVNGNTAFKQAAPTNLGTPAGYYNESLTWQGPSGGPHGHSPGQQPMGRRPGGAATRRRGGRVSRSKMHLGGPVHNHPHRAKQMNRPRGGRNFGMCIEGTNQRYTGRTVNLGGVHYTTKGGAKEGNGKRLTNC